MSLTSERFHGVKDTFQKLKPMLKAITNPSLLLFLHHFFFPHVLFCFFYNYSCHETVAAGTFFPFEGQNKLAGTV